MIPLEKLRHPRKSNWFSGRQVVFGVEVIIVEEIGQEFVEETVGEAVEN